MPTGDARQEPEDDGAAHGDRSSGAELLDGITGAYERAQLGLRQAEAGETISLDDL